jgi:hypothetical protein
VASSREGGIVSVALLVVVGGALALADRGACAVRSWRHGAFNPIVLRQLKRLDRAVRTVFLVMDSPWTAELLEGRAPHAGGGRDDPELVVAKARRDALRHE